jgi:concanavalin A-like lectin/glucanase superfamily protein
MALKLTGNRKFPSLPSVGISLDNHTAFLQIVKEALEISQRRTSDVLNSHIRVQDLIDLGLITIEGNTTSIVGADLSQIANIGDLTGAAEGDFLRFRSGEWVNDDLSNTDITQVMVTQHQAALDIDWSQLSNVSAMIDSLGALTDPGADRIVFWDESANDLAFLTVGTGLNLSGTTLEATGSGGGAQYLDDLLDVNALYPTVGDVLTFDGAEWINSASSAGGGTLLFGESDVSVGNTVTNTTTETTFASSYIIDSLQFTLGRVFKGQIRGTYSTDAVSPGTLRVRIKLGSTTILDTTAFTPTSAITDGGWCIDFMFIVTTTGSGGQVEAQGIAVFSAAADDAKVCLLENTARISVNLSLSQTISVTAQWGTADADNDIQIRQITLNAETAAAEELTVLALLHFDGTDGSNVIIDETGKQWIAVGDAQLDDTQSKFGGTSLLLDGTGDYVDAMTDEDFLIGTGDFTIEGWVRFDTLSGNNFVFTFAGGWGLYTFSNQWAVFDGVSTNAIQGGSVAADTWYHFALVRQGTNLYLFIDGVQVGSTGTMSTNITNPSYRLGAQPAATGLMTGWIDDFRILGQALYTSAFTVPTTQYPDPDVVTTYEVSLLHFDGVDGATSFIDEMGKVWTAHNQAQLDTAQFKFGTASLLLDGTDDYITSPDADDVSFGADNWTVEGFVRFNGDPGTGLASFVSHYDASGNQRGWVVGLNNNTLRLLYSTDGTGTTVLSAAWNPATATWYHFAVCRRGTTVYFFIDGVQLGTASISTNTIFNANTTLQIGTQSNGADGDVNGWIDEVRITAGHARYTAAFTPPNVPFPNP